MSHEPTAHTQNESEPVTQLHPNDHEPDHTLPAVSEANIPQTHANRQPPKNTHTMRTRAKNNIHKPNPRLTYNVSKKTPLAPEPKTVHQALKDEKWRKAMSLEYDAHTYQHTWDLQPPSPQYNVIGCKWIYTTKYLANGKVDRHKARLVAKGYTQQYGVDYSKTFSPVIKTTTIRLVLEVAVTKSWPLKQLDVNNAFLQGELTEEVYMSQPQGFIDQYRPEYVCRLRKPIYGLKQAPRSWYMSLKQHLLQSGFTNSLADALLFIHTQGVHHTYVLVYVDDIIVTGSNSKFVQRVLDAFSEQFSIKDPVDLHYFLGIEVIRSPKGLHLMQRK